MKTIAIYHKDCNDGTTAAAVVLRRYPDALVFPLSHGYFPEEVEEIIAKAEKGDRILTVDCVMGVKEFLAKGFKVTSIDHHIGGKEEYSAIAGSNPDFTYIFDNDKSGASLAWSVLFPGEPVPELVRLVEDSDIWKWRYGEDTKSVNSYIFLLANKPERVLPLLDGPLDDAKREGGAISRYSDYMVDWAVRTIDPVTLKIGGREVFAYNLTSYKSEAGNTLSKAKDQAVGIFNIDGGEVRISFRSLDAHSPSALDLAKALGGGGHRNAAAARMTLGEFLNLLSK
ncbi:MAG: phosphoesterase [Candidatus Taylorbacteria bacterium]|nr:phosphoesterase [Candidatus Taylorbacteria bacterium]